MTETRGWTDYPLYREGPNGEEEHLIVVTYRSWFYRETGPSYSCGGEPEDGGVEIDRITCGKQPFEVTDAEEEAITQYIWENPQ